MKTETETDKRKCLCLVDVMEGERESPTKIRKGSEKREEDDGDRLERVAS